MPLPGLPPPPPEEDHPDKHAEEEEEEEEEEQTSEEGSDAFDFEAGEDYYHQPPPPPPTSAAPNLMLRIGSHPGSTVVAGSNKLRPTTGVEGVIGPASGSDRMHGASKETANSNMQGQSFSQNPNHRSSGEEYGAAGGGRKKGRSGSVVAKFFGSGVRTPSETSPGGGVDRKLKPRRTRFSIFSKKPARKGKSRRQRFSTKRESWDMSAALDNGRTGLLKVYSVGANLDGDASYGDLVRSDNGFCHFFEELFCCRSKSPEQKREDTFLFGRLGPIKFLDKGEGSPAEQTEAKELLKAGNRTLSRLLILPPILLLLIMVDIWKTLRWPTPEFSERGGLYKPGRAGMLDSWIFVLPPLVHMAFNTVVVIAAYSRCSWAYTHQSRRRLQLMSYVVYIVALSVTEFAMKWSGFGDSSVYALVAFIYSFSRASIKRCRDISSVIILIYFFSNLLGLVWPESESIQSTTVGWLRALQVVPWMMVCHIVYWLPESSSRASYKLKVQFGEETSRLIKAAESSKEMLQRVLPAALIPRVVRVGTVIWFLFSMVPARPLPHAAAAN